MKIGITGCKGRMGSALVREILSGQRAGAELAGGTALPQDLDEGGGFFMTASPDELFERSDAVIDFTSPEATRQHVWLAAKHHKTLVIGTTGLGEADEKEIRDAARETRIVRAANFSVGINALLALAERAAAALPAEGWDIEIFESHHKHKIDAPSGTALALGKAAAQGRGISPLSPPLPLGEKNHKKPPLPPGEGWGEGDGREGQFAFERAGKRKTGDIGFAVARGGDVVGDHSVFFYGEGERIELSHRATDRALFARGAIRAALWAPDQKPGLYSMRDVLGL